MNLNKESAKNLLLVLCAAAAFYAAAQHPAVVWDGVKSALGVVSPFLLGGSLAFVLNVPMRAIERHVFPKERQMDRLRRPLALIGALLAVIGVLTVAMWVIFPGVKIALDALTSRAAQLPEISLDKPKRVIGKNTVECMRSGTMYGTAAMIDGIVDRISEELGHSSTIIATGGMAQFITPLCRHRIILERDLLLKGLNIIYKKNKH